MTLTQPGRSGRARVPRALHPMAWWVWAIGVVTAVSRTSNPLLLIVALAVLAFVVASRRSDAPWARAFKYYLIMAAVVIVIRVIFRSIFATGVGGTDHILFRLPHIHLPGWYAGVQLGGPVSLEATLAASFDGLRLGTLLCCVGAANVLANPKRALRVLPGALYELGVAVTVALSVAPQLVESAQRVNRARRLRGTTHGRGLARTRALRAVVIPVLEDAFERSLRLAAGMDARGYGRTGRVTPRARRLTAALMLAGMCGLCVGVFGLLGGSLSRATCLSIVGAGAATCLTGLLTGGRRVRRTAYRPDPWRAPEWIVAGGGVACAVIMFVSSGYDATTAAALDPSLYPLRWPTLPLLPTLGILLAGAAALAAPPPVRARPARPSTTAPAPVAEPAGMEREAVSA